MHCKQKLGKNLAEWRGYKNDNFSCNRDHIEISFVVHSISIPRCLENWSIQIEKICKVLSGIIYVLLFLLEKTCKYKELENGDTKINYSGTHNESNMRIKV